MLKNVTITLEEEVARWARVRAAEADTSVSRLVGEMLREKMTTEEGYRAARERFFAPEPRALRRRGEALPARDAVHDRSGLR